MSERSRTMIAAAQVSLDGYMQGANGEVDWVDSWSEALDMLADVDACVVGGGMYPGYEQLWGSIAVDPQSGTAMLGRLPSDREVEYAHWAQRTPHYVLSTTLDSVTWDTAYLVRDVSELRSLKEQPGRTIYVIGGASVVSSLMNEGLLDELRLIMHPLVLGGGKGPFGGVTHPHRLELAQSEAGRLGRVHLMYRVLA